MKLFFRSFFILLFFTLCVSLLSCSKSKKENTKNNYYIHYSIGLVFDLHINDIKLDSGKGDAVIANYSDITSYLKKGENSITLKLSTKDNQNLTKDALKDITLDIYSAPEENNEDVSLVKRLTFKNTSDSLPILTKNWSFEVKKTVLKVNKNRS